MNELRKRMKAFGGRGMCGVGGDAAALVDAAAGEEGDDGEAGGGVALRLCDARLGFDSLGAGASKKKNAGPGVEGSGFGSTGVDGSSSNVVVKSVDSSNAPGVRFVAKEIPGARDGSVHTSWLPVVPSQYTNWKGRDRVWGDA
jgi:hypothetical protein